MVGGHWDGGREMQVVDDGERVNDYRVPQDTVGSSFYLLQTSLQRPQQLSLSWCLWPSLLQ